MVLRGRDIAMHPLESRILVGAIMGTQHSNEHLFFIGLV